MIFIILVIVGSMGVLGTLYLSSGIPSQDQAVSPWYTLHPENFQTGLTQAVRIWIKNLLKVALIWMIRKYRTISEKVTVKQVLKQKVRKFLYEHEPGTVRHPSEFWNKVRKQKKPNLAEPLETPSVLENKEHL